MSSYDNDPNLVLPGRRLVVAGGRTKNTEITTPAEAFVIARGASTLNAAKV